MLELPRWERDKELQERKKRAEVDKSRRIVKHPNFHNLTLKKPKHTSTSKNEAT
jgi:hypothetical protein